MPFPNDFFVLPAGNHVPNGVYIAVARRPMMANPFTLGTSYFCPGKVECMYTCSFNEIMHTKIAVDPEESEERRAASRQVLLEVKGVPPKKPFIGPKELGCAPLKVPLNMIHFPALRTEQCVAQEHALLIGPCSKEEYDVSVRALSQAGVDETYTTMFITGVRE